MRAEGHPVFDASSQASGQLLYFRWRYGSLKIALVLVRLDHGAISKHESPKALQAHPESRCGTKMWYQRENKRGLAGEA